MPSTNPLERLDEDGEAPRQRGRHPPLRGNAMRHGIGRIKQKLNRWADAGGERPEEAPPDAVDRPADGAVVERLRWTVLARRLQPGSTRPRHLRNAADHTPISHPLGSSGARRRLCALLRARLRMGISSTRGAVIHTVYVDTKDARPLGRDRAGDQTVSDRFHRRGMVADRPAVAAACETRTQAERGHA